jgi:hypothetical protein
MATIKSSAAQLALALLAVSPVVLSPAQAQEPTGYSGPGRYEIQNVASGKVLDADLRDGRSVRQWAAAYGSDQPNPPNNVRNQQWDIEDAGFGFVHIKSAQNGMVLDVEKPAIRQGVPVILTHPAKDDSQLWRIEDAGQGQVKLTSRLGKSLDLPDGSRSNGTHFQIFPANPGDNQKFVLIRIDGRREHGPELAQLAYPDHDRDRDHDRDHDRDRREPERFTPDRSERGSYELGYSQGLEDSRSQVRRSYARHKGQYNPQFEEAYIDGYYDGYDNGREGSSRMRDTDRGPYDIGYRLGRDDAQDNRRSDYMRYADRFDPRAEAIFRRGYADGYHASTDRR